MPGKKRILVACGTAIATSTVVAKAVEEILASKGIEVTTQQCKATEVPFLAEGMDLVLTTTPVPAGLDIPVIQTLAFLTGIGKDDVIEQIVRILDEK